MHTYLFEDLDYTDPNIIKSLRVDGLEQRDDLSKLRSFLNNSNLIELELIRVPMLSAILTYLPTTLISLSISNISNFDLNMFINIVYRLINLRSLTLRDVGLRPNDFLNIIRLYTSIPNLDILDLSDNFTTEESNIFVIEWYQDPKRYENIDIIGLKLYNMLENESLSNYVNRLKKAISYYNSVVFADDKNLPNEMLLPILNGTYRFEESVIRYYINLLEDKRLDINKNKKRELKDDSEDDIEYYRTGFKRPRIFRINEQIQQEQPQYEDQRYIDDSFNDEGSVGSYEEDYDASYNSISEVSDLSFESFGSYSD